MDRPTEMPASQGSKENLRRETVSSQSQSEIGAQCLHSATEQRVEHPLPASNHRDLVSILSAEGTLVMVSPAFLQLLGCNESEVIGRHLADWLHPEDAEALRRMFAEMKLGHSRSIVCRIRRKDGGFLGTECTLTSLGDTLTGETESIVAVLREVMPQADGCVPGANKDPERLFLEQSISGYALHEVICDSDGKPVDFRFLEVNPAFERLTGQTANQVVGRTAREVMPGVEPQWIEFFCNVGLTGQAVTWEDSVSRGGRWYAGAAFCPRIGQFAVTFNDVSDRKRAQEAADEWRERLDLAVSGSHAGLWDIVFGPGDSIETVDDAYLSPAMKAFIGYEENEFPNSMAAWRSRIHADDLRGLFAAAQAHLLGRVDFCEAEYRIRHRDGSVRWLRSRGNIRKNDKGEPVRWSGMDWDITSLKQLEQQLRHDALHDVLTGLPNRTLLMDRLAHSITVTSRTPEYHFAVLFFDLDDFKNINDLYGHLAGDTVLLEVARSLRLCIRPGDTVARMGGDEFVILLEFLQYEQEAFSVAERILRTLATPLDICGHEMVISASIGIIFSHSGFASNASDFLRRADIAMYRAKQLGKNRYCVFDVSMHDEVVHRVTMEEQFRRALKNSEFSLLYQPIVNVNDGRLVGFEALARWNHPEKGVILPSVFIPAAEASNLILPYGQWLVEEVMRQADVWKRRYGWCPPMHVNFSASQLGDEGFDECLRRAVRRYGGFPAELHLELTESVLMNMTSQTIRWLERLRDSGVSLAIDDFGTGYSSLAYLGHLPISSVKIDRSFVAQLGCEGPSCEVVRAICALARAFNMQVTAEGIETRDQLNAIRTVFCQYAQGHYFTPPLESVAAGEFLASSLQAKVPEA